MTLAIVIPYYKLTFFRETLQSLSEQTDKRFKVYIGDDASPENPSFLLAGYADTFDFEYKRFENNLGSESLVKQWERCIEMIGDEEWIMILGDDDVLGENVVEEFYKSLTQPDFDSNVIRCATIVLDEQQNTKSELFTHPRLETGLEFSLRKLRGFTRSSLSEYFFKTENYLKYRFSDFPDAFFSDDKAWLDFSESKLIYTINESIIYIRISNFSLSGMVDKKLLSTAELEYLKLLFVNRLSFIEKDNDYFFILRRLEDSFDKNNLKSIQLWFCLYTAYFKRIRFNEFSKFHKRILIKVFK